MYHGWLKVTAIAITVWAGFDSIQLLTLPTLRVTPDVENGLPALISYRLFGKAAVRGRCSL